MKVYAKFRIDIDKEDESIYTQKAVNLTVQFHGKIYVYRGH